ncbi:hypothetical protein ASPVEDRAFT_82281 [Aspergillus versicolor CBS 583.65]|uniref:Uncharacterized protein n=1 Tax=Aspergillus versicolor CBS 583.65 TaxID=1036611 RepID=A0A1L9PGX5_ASPVE|nr:uncharacterized protein ASPVEDRAFT_82281 [Aspergillus versicolor CBS 583.65]OJJ00723.1 hypothetical protein ASPVEDRAFT_82281 [Aspergillus versicolor CBS 583.65]
MKTQIPLLAALVVAPSLGCTILNGHIEIQSGYQGDVALDGVTEVHGNISTVEDGAEGLGLFELYDLVTIDAIHLQGISGDVHLPNLESIGDLELVQKKDKGEADLGSLVEAENVLVLGSWTSTNFESLRTVAKEIHFCGSTDCGIYPDTKFPYIAVDLPSLEETNHFEVAGTVNSVSVPNLEVVGYADQSANDGSQGLRINIQEGGETLDFDAPKMHTLTGTLEVYGGVSGLSMGALGETNVGATINARAPLDIYSTIKTARHFYLWQEIHSVYLPKMKDLGLVDTGYTSKLACNDTLYQLWGAVADNDRNPCHGYDFPQDPATEVNGTSSATPSATPSPTSSGIPESTSHDGPSSDTNANSDGSQDSENDTEEGPGNGAGRVLAAPLAAGFVVIGLGLGLL